MPHVPLKGNAAADLTIRKMPENNEEVFSFVFATFSFISSNKFLGAPLFPFINDIIDLKDDRINKYGYDSCIHNLR